MINTLAEFESLPDDEQIRLERIAIMVAEGIMEEEAIAIVDQKQGELFNKKAHHTSTDGAGWSF